MPRIFARYFIGLVLVFGAASLLGACNTTAGAGKDVSAVGHAVTDSANRNK